MESKTSAVFSKFVSESDAGDIVALAKDAEKKVCAFLRENHVLNGDVSGHDVYEVSSAYGLESFDTSMAEGTSIDELLVSLKVPEKNRAEAKAEIGVILTRFAEAGGGNASKLWRNHMQSSDAAARSTNGYVSYYERMMPSNINGLYGNTSDLQASLEYFGVDTNKMESDIVTAIVITAMKFHNAVAPRLMHTISSVNPLIRFIRDDQVVFDLAGDGADGMTNVLDLYDDPSMVTNELTKITPLASFDSIDYEGYIPKDETIRLFEVSMTSKYGHETFNRTDLVADDARLEEILLTISYDDKAAQDPTVHAAEQLAISIPASIGRLYRYDNSNTTARGAFINGFTAGLTLTTKNVLSAACAPIVEVLGAASTDKVLVTINAYPTLDIRSSDAAIHGNLTFSVVSQAGAPVVNAKAQHLTITFEGAKFDARYSEENMRKSSIIATSTPSAMIVEIPPGRFYGADRSHQTVQSGEDRALQVSLLNKLAAIGQDDAAIKTIISTLDDVRAMETAWKLDPINNPRPGKYYAAGGKVNPSVIYATMAFSGIEMFDDGRINDAIIARVKTQMSAIIVDLMQNSKMKQQMGAETLRFRALCSGELLGKIIGVAPDAGTEEGSGVEFTLALNGNVKVEFVTTTFTSLGDQIILVPYLNNTESDLNFGHNRNCGTVVVGYTATHTSTASAERLMASLREAVVPTNVVGAIITVTGISGTTFGYTNA